MKLKSRLSITKESQFPWYYQGGYNLLGIIKLVGYIRKVILSEIKEFTVLDDLAKLLESRLKDNSFIANHPANTRHSPNVSSKLGKRRRRWTSIEETMGECLVLADHVYCRGLNVCIPFY